MHCTVDPVKFGLVASLNRPGGNITGIAALQAELVAKRIELLHELVPKAKVAALLVNPDNPYTEPEARAVQEAARSLRLGELQILRASSGSEIDAAFGKLPQLHVDALIVSADLFLLSQHRQIVERATQQTLPTMYPWREYVSGGGLVSYGPSLFEAYRLVGVYTGKILRGAPPADLPVEQASKVDLVINLKATKAFHVSVPSLQLWAGPTRSSNKHAMSAIGTSGHAELRCTCLLSGVKRTCRFALQMSAFDPKRTSGLMGKRGWLYAVSPSPPSRLPCDG